MARLKAEEKRLRQLQKAEETAKKLENAQKTKEQLEAKREQTKKPSRDVYKFKLVCEIQERNKAKNYEILKNLQRKRFQSVKDRKVKAEILNKKLQKAEERRQQILQQKVEKAITMACLNQSPEKEAKQELLTTKPIQVVQDYVKPTLRSSRAASLQKSTESESDTFEVISQVQDKIGKRQIEDKLAKAAARHQERLQQKVNKAKELYTKFGPTLQERLNLKLHREEIWARSKTARPVQATWRKDFFYSSVDKAADKYVFVQQSLGDRQPLETTKNMKNIKAKPAAIAFEIDRASSPKAFKFNRANVGNQTPK